MADTLYHCLVDVTNSLTETTSPVSPIKDGLVSSQDDNDQVPSLASPSTASTTSSPSSSLVEVTLATCGKRPYNTISPTSSSVIVLENEPPSSALSATTGISKRGPLEVTGLDLSLQSQLLDQQQQQHIDKIYPLGKTTHPGESKELNRRDHSERHLDLILPKRRKLDAHSQLQDSTITDDTAESQSSAPLCTSSIPVSALPSTPISLHSTSPSTLMTSTSSQPLLVTQDQEALATICDLPETFVIASSTLTPTTPHLACMECKTSSTILWRKGPEGRQTLCNACGLRYSKFCRGARPFWKLSSLTTSPRKKDTQKTPTHDFASPEKASSSSSPSPSPKATTRKKDTHKDNISPKNNGLRERKVYLKSGMYSSGAKQCHSAATMDLSRFSFTLPLHQGAIILEKEKDFRLPLDLMQDYESGRLFGWTDYESSKKPPRYIRVLQNSYVERKPRKEDDDNAVCKCMPPKEGLGCGDDCLNRMMFFECDPSTCPCGDMCSNQRFKKRQFVKTLKVYLTDGRGWGIRTKDAIQRGTLITEYRGEIISDKTCQERIRTEYKHQKNFYFLDYHKGEVIDACSKGSEARFINHGCDPNCHIEKWSRGGEYHLGVFASQDIPAGSELFYDYNFSLFDTEAIGQECRCGSANCRGFLGKRPGPVRK